MWLLHWLTYQMTVWLTTETLLIWQITSLLCPVHYRREQQYVSLLWHVVCVDKGKAFLKKQRGLEFPLHFCPKNSTCTVLFNRRQEAAEGGVRKRQDEAVLHQRRCTQKWPLYLTAEHKKPCVFVCVCVRACVCVWAFSAQSHPCLDVCFMNLCAFLP